MTTHLALVGEQPMPVLLTDRYIKPRCTILVCTERTRPAAMRLQALLPHAAVKVIDDAYDLLRIGAALKDLASAGTGGEPWIINLTGGTKMMSLGAFLHAVQNNLQFVYLESEGANSVLDRFSWHDNRLQRQARTVLDMELITAADYVRAHVGDYDEQGYSRDDSGAVSFGGELERAVHLALKDKFEVLAGVQPRHAAQQVEIDLVLRDGNQVAIAEVKFGGKEDRPKRAIDQLSTAGAREYFGTYTARLLILANPLPRRTAALAKARGITVIELQAYQPGLSLTAADTRKLVQSVRGALHRTGSAS